LPTFSQIAFVPHSWFDIHYQCPLWTPLTPFVASRESAPYFCSQFKVFYVLHLENLFLPSSSNNWHLFISELFKRNSFPL
jgi:hypothetical protein